MHIKYRRVAGRDALQVDTFECRQRAIVQRRDQCGAAGVGDLSVAEKLAEAERLELRQPWIRQRQRTCQRRRRHKGGEAFVAQRVRKIKFEVLQRR